MTNTKNQIPKSPTVEEIMSKNVIAVKMEYSLLEVSKILTKNKISSVPVLDNENKIVGFISSKDCISCLINCTFHDEFRNKYAVDIMSSDIKAIKENADLFELDQMFVSQNLYHMPVINDQGALVGMVSRKDALQASENLYEQTWHHKEELKAPVHLSHYEHMKYMVQSYTSK